MHWLCNNGYLDAIKLLLGFDAFPNHMENSEERYYLSDCIILSLVKVLRSGLNVKCSDITRES